MVKTNRPVLLTCYDRIVLWKILYVADIAVITAHEPCVTQFQGYVLSITLAHQPSQPSLVDLASSGTSPMAPHSVMILAKDLDSLRETLMEEDSSTTLCTIDVAPNLETALPHYKDTISAFFSEQTQEALISPLGKHMRGFENFAINGQFYLL